MNLIRPGRNYLILSLVFSLLCTGAAASPALPGFASKRAVTIKIAAVWEELVGTRKYYCTLDSKNRAVAVTKVKKDFVLTSTLLKLLKNNNSLSAKKKKLQYQAAQKACVGKSPPKDSPTATPTIAPSPTSTPIGATPTPNLAPRPQNLTLTVAEGGSIQFALAANDPEHDALSFEVVAAPQHGRLVGTLPNLTYVLDGDNTHFIGSDSLRFTAFDGTSSAEGSVNFTVERSGAAEFAGDFSSLRPYRQQISIKECRHLCVKAALGCTQNLILECSVIGLPAFVDKLLTMPTDPAVMSEALSYSKTIDGRWGLTEARRYVTVLLLRGNPLQMRMFLLWHDHFATALNNFSNSSSSHDFIGLHINLLLANSLGSFDQLFNSMAFDPAMGYWLDNRYNNKNSFNQNFARESLELFSTGTMDRFTGTPNYNEADVQQMTRALSGFFSTYQFGSEAYAFNQAFWDNTSKTLFAGTPYAASGTWKPEVDSERIPAFDAALYNHPSTSRNLALKIASQLVSPLISEGNVDELADNLRANHYDMQVFLKKLLTSSMMFAPEARKSCISSPAEQIITTLRLTNLPVTNINTITSVYNYMHYSGQQLLTPPDVFGWKGCGVGQRDTSRAFGESFTPAQYLIERQRNLTFILNEIFTREGGAGAVDRLLPSPSATDGATLDYIMGLFMIELNPTQRATIIANFMNKEKNGANSYIAKPWNPLDLTTTRKRVAGLLEVAMRYPGGAIQ